MRRAVVRRHEVVAQLDRARTRSSTAGIVSVLPSDFDIFSPDIVTQALCSQYSANPSPAARDWASSFSWCGNTRSRPPPWMSNSAPR